MAKQKKYKEGVDYTVVIDEQGNEQNVLTKFTFDDFQKLINDIKSIGMTPVLLYWEKGEGYSKVEMQENMLEAYYDYTSDKVFHNLYSPKESVEIIGEMPETI